MTNMIHVPVDMEKLEKWSQARDISCRGSIDRQVSIHKLSDECFGQSTLKPFRLMSNRSGQASLYGYTGKAVEDLTCTARVIACPNILEIVDVDRIKSKPLPKQWIVGQRVGFDLITIPERRLTGSNKRQDAHMIACVKAEVAQAPELPARHDTYCSWLQEKLADAAILDLDATTIKMNCVPIKLGNRELLKTEVTYVGDLTIQDPGAFNRALENGVGRYKSYGYGMILLRAPQDRQRRGARET